MSRYTAAARWGWQNPHESPFTAPDAIRLSPACRAAAELGAYFWRRNMPAPDSVAYVGGRKAPVLIADGEALAVHSEYPGTVIRPA
jgi:hypothetical protein